MKSKKELGLILVLLAAFILVIGCSSKDSITGDAVLEGDDESVDEDLAAEEVTPIEAQGLTKAESTPLQATKIKAEYDSSKFADCGVYVRRNNAEGNEGNYLDMYSCFTKAVESCGQAKAYADIQTQEGARMVSFLSTSSCKITNHIKGNDPYGFTGEEMKTCEDLNPNLALHYACIGYI